MQKNESGAESGAEDIQNKRKRDTENDTTSEGENEVASKRIKSSENKKNESGAESGAEDIENKRKRDTENDTASESESEVASERMKSSGKKKSTKKDKDDAAKKQKENDKAVVRLKRYISLCGERRNYKKLLGECRSVRAMVDVLKKELEDIGVHGQASLEKCKKVRLKKEEARELAELDVGNIIDCQGRPKRRGALAQQQQHKSPLDAVRRLVSSDSDEENVQQGRRATNWDNLKGIISDDADSD
ncbi:HIRA-interacting protein 3 isoform X1 [Syngnathus typhle]|uniref:HIRA-interacting protein 3 isoform X1 n=1 Tax=Syngnathus typhle TaxID=161592 RepID=UPI002A6A2E45|nr:HIRA-interacting protein 3 isoform X1 [Syngnathus typhle]